MQSNTIYIRNFHTSLQTKIPLYENEKKYTPFADGREFDRDSNVVFTPAMIYRIYAHETPSFGIPLCRAYRRTRVPVYFRPKAE